MDWDPQSTETHGYICPPCPVFHPTHEQFKHPLKYISSIRHIGEQAGICKIVPPQGWRPPFAINDKTFRFRTRVQQLNCIDGHSRAEGNFVEALRMFLYRSGTPMQELPRVHGQLVNLRLLYRTVVELGGFDCVCASALWPQVVRRVGRTRSANAPDAELCSAYERHYRTCLLAYERHERTSGLKTEATPFQTPDVVKRPSSLGPSATASTAAASASSATVAAAATTPHSKTRSSMKKQPRTETGSELVAGDASASSSASAAVAGASSVKRTLFAEGGHTSSEENDGQSSDSKASVRAVRMKREAAQTNSKSEPKATATEVLSDDDDEDEDDEDEPLAQLVKRSKTLTPAALKPDPLRSTRLSPPEIVVGQRFYQFFPDCGAVLAQVKRVVSGGKKPHVRVQYVADSSRDSFDLATMQILIANGWDPDAAELAYKSEICQTCLRGDCWDKMLLCDGCNTGHHLFCLNPPLAAVPPGDWYCSTCVEEAAANEHETNLKFGFEMGSEYSLTAYKAKADAWKREYFGAAATDDSAAELTDAALEREYWRLLSIPVHEKRLEVEYGSDIDSGSVGSGFPHVDSYLKCLRLVTKRLKYAQTPGASAHASHKMDAFFSHGLDAHASGAASSTPGDLEALLRTYALDDWNLNNLPKLPGSVLQHLDEDIKGVMVPWIYMGMCFSTFCWHVEDHNFYSMSYNHCGAPKTWYGVPSHAAAHFEATMKALTPELFGSQPDLHLQLVTMFSPATLRQHGVPVYRATHAPNEFMVTFPSAYHGGFNNGFNCAEAVNFATVDWLPWGAASVRKYREFRKLPVFAHEALVCSLAETLVESSAFDAASARAYLLPAMQQLYDDFVTFEAHVRASGVAASEEMAAFEARHHAIATASTMPMRASKKRMMATNDCDECATDGAPPLVRTGLVKTAAADASTSAAPSSKMRSASSLQARPTRMVLWAGQSGKHEGLRCVACQQYCYLQAIVCTKCRHHAAVGCLEHFATMCACDSATHYVYLWRYDAAHLAAVLAAMQTRLRAVDDWDAAYERAMGTASDDAMDGTATSEQRVRPSVEAVKSLLLEGKQCGGARAERLDALETALASAAAWTAKAEQLLARHEETSGAALDVHAVLALAHAADALAVVPDKRECVESLLTAWRRCQQASDALLRDIAALQQTEAASLFNIRNPRESRELWSESKRHQVTIATIGHLVDEIRRMGLEQQDNVVARLQQAQQYLEVLVSANAAITVIAKSIDRGRTASRTSGASSGSDRTPAPVTETACRLVVVSADALALEPHARMFKVEVLRSFLDVTETEGEALRAALADHSKSVEELDALLRRLESLPVVPDGLSELADRLAKCRAWEDRAAYLINLRESVERRPTLEDIEAFYAQADEWLVPTTSLLRRQIHSRIQDCRRWYMAVHSVFLRPTDTQSVPQFLHAAIAKYHAVATQQEAPEHSRLHCVCEQVMPDTTRAATCERCGALFHEQCVDQHPLTSAKARASRSGARAFLCPGCQPTPQHKASGASTQQQQQQSASFPGSLHLRATLGSQGVPLFCHCRGAEDAAMICCDFCDEWYHAECIGMPFEVMNHIEAFRCQRCAIKQNLYYLDKRARWRRDFLGRRPAVSRVDALVAQLETSLLALPPGARELLAYVALVKQLDASVQACVERFAQDFAPEAFATMNYGAEEAKTLALLHRVTALEVALDVALGRLGAIHWCLRACRMVLGCESAPKYSHLVVLLDDLRQPHFAFPCVEYYHIQLTIEDRVAKASQWLKQTKTLEVEEWNVTKARRLMREYQELSQFLELPVAEVNLVHQIVANADADDAAMASDKRRRLV